MKFKIQINIRGQHNFTWTSS